jgi:hypothetical protein
MNLALGYDSHPAADLFPLMAETELQALADDIEQHGLQEPIILLDGLVLDGRNRLLACERTSRDPRFERWSGTGSPTTWVLSKNLHRRHLTASQQALVVAEAKRLAEAESPNLDSESVDSIARSAGVSRSSVFTAQQVVDKAVPELTKAVRDGAVKISAAAALADEPAEKQRELVAAGPKAIKDAAREKRKPSPKLSAAERERLTAIAKGKEVEEESSDAPDEFNPHAAAAELFKVMATVLSKWPIEHSLDPLISVTKQALSRMERTKEERLNG